MILLVAYFFSGNYMGQGRAEKLIKKNKRPGGTGTKI